MDKFQVALAQLKPLLFDKDFNLAKAKKHINLAATRGASAIIFPELYLTGYSLGKRTVEMAETIDGPSIRCIVALAKQYKIAVLMGFPELNPQNNHIYDSMFIVDEKGHFCGSYRKTHLFQTEKIWFHPGMNFSVIDFGLGPTGLLICYDLEFPEAARTLALNGAKWIATSTGNMVPNQHLQEINVQARAAENRLWVAVANRVGQEGNLSFFGGSAVADPYGNLIAQSKDGEELLFVDIDLARATKARLNADYLVDRRPEIYNPTLPKTENA